MTEAPLASPCVRNCCLDDLDICLGCQRSVEEIIAWGPASNAERLAVLERAAVRAQARQQSQIRGQARSYTTPAQRPAI